MAPWDHHSALQQSRLIAIAKLIEIGRDDALARNDETIGCNSWTVGSEAYAFSKFQIEKASSSLAWLEIVDPGMQFTFAIGGVPVRFYKGDPVGPTKRTLKQSYPELRQLDLFASEALDSLTGQPAFRFAIETDVDGSLLAVTFVVLANDLPVSTWKVPLDVTTTKPVDLWSDAPAAGVELEAPVVGLVRDLVDKEESSDKG